MVNNLRLSKILVNLFDKKSNLYTNQKSLYNVHTFLFLWKKLSFLQFKKWKRDFLFEWQLPTLPWILYSFEASFFLLVCLFLPGKDTNINFSIDIPFLRLFLLHPSPATYFHNISQYQNIIHNSTARIYIFSWSLL